VRKTDGKDFTDREIISKLCTRVLELQDRLNKLEGNCRSDQISKAIANDPRHSYKLK